MKPGFFDDLVKQHSQRSQNFAPLPVCWPTLTTAETETRLDELADWIDWLTERYALDYRTIPPCWARHGSLLEELSALRTGWLTAYAQEARGDAPLQWHSDFATARLRLAEWTARAGCRPSEHRPTH